jgi:RNA polymerase sigma factor (sigma-70 family)
MPRIKAVLSLDYEQKTQSRSGAQGGSLNVLQNDKSMREDETLMERTQLQADVIAAMTRNLDAREARLMRLRYGLSDGVTRSLAECADAMGLSRTRVQQISQRCLQKLRQAAEAESLQEYLLTIA